MRIWLAALAALALAAGAAHAAGVKTVKDWTAVCDNLGDCQAFGFTSQDTDDDAYLIIKRQGGPAAAPSVTIAYEPQDAQPATEWRLTLDTHPIAGIGPLHASGSEGGARAVLTGAAAMALIEAMKSGQKLGVESPDGKSAFDISLAGSAAILLWTDDQQGRVGTATALSRRGVKPASAVPPRGTVPVIAAAAPVGQQGLPKDAPKSLAKSDPDDCDADERPTSDPDDIVARLAPGVVLWGPECAMAAYNMTSIFFLGDEHAGHLKRIKLPEAPGAGQASDDFLINAEFDPKTQTLSQFSKGRGIGDCGEAASWIWDGKAFVLLSEDTMPECHGVILDDWPPLFVGKRG